MSALYVLVNGFLSIGLLTLLSAVTGSPFIFPSLGPTAYILFFTPLSPTVCPRNTLLGHALGLAVGFSAYWTLVLHHGFLTAHPGGYWPGVFAAAAALSITGALLVLLRIDHAPAGATALIVALGILSKPTYLFIIEAAVVLLVLQAFCINRLAGLPYPLWRAPSPDLVAPAKVKLI